MKISAIIPALNEESVIENSLRSLSAARPYEIIVVDGGSVDATVRIAERFARVLSCEKGRALQMNAGAQKATGDVLLFLHADTCLPEDGLGLIRQALEKNRDAGRFRVSFDAPDFLLRCFAFYTRFHAFSYGDQAFFLRRNLFESLGGFDPVVPFEDIEFYKRLRRKTHPIILPQAVITSARRFRQAGSMKQKWINLLLVALYHAGIDIFPLKRKWYPDVR